MVILSAFLQYAAKLAVFAVVAGLGVAVGIKFRKTKDAKAGKEQTNE